MEFNSLTLTLRAFVAAFQGGYDRISGSVHFLIAALATIEIALFGAWWALDGGHQLSAAFKKMLGMGIWVWICTSFPKLSKAFVDSLVKVGLMAGGDPGASTELLMDPSRLAGYGLDVTHPLAEKLEAMSVTDGADLLIFGLSYIAIMVGFFVLAIQVFLAVLEYYMLAALVGIFLPFGLLPATKFLAEKAVGAIVASGIKLMTLAFILAVAEPVLRKIHFGSSEVALNELWSVFLTTCSLALLCWKAPNMAAGLLAGSPTLSFGDVTRPVTNAATTALAAAGGALTAVATKVIRSASSTTQTAQASSSAATPSTAAAGLAKSASHQPATAPNPPQLS